MNKLRTGILVGTIALGSVLGVAGPALATTVNAGGGTWNYGTGFVFPIYKDVWSNYVNNASYHSSTAIGGSAIKKVFANATSWSYARVQCGAGESTAVYYGNY